MASESAKIIYRRFMGRVLESGLLIIAVALGVGAASAGFSLLANANAVGQKTLQTVTYRELVVSTRTSADEMSVPAAKKTAGAEAVLTSADLDAAQLAPDVRYSYVRNDTELHFINENNNNNWGPPPATGAAQANASAAQANAGNAQTKASGAKAAAPNGQGWQGPQQMSADDIAKAKAEADIVVVSDMDDIRGFVVTGQFFDAWGMKAAHGSLFSDSDSKAGTNSLVLGAEAAKQIVGNGKDPTSLVGKKILAREGYETVVGILAPTGQANYDASIFAPYKLVGAGGDTHRAQFNTQLRFTVSDPSKLSQTEELLSGWFSSRFGENQIVISNPRGEAQRIIARNQGIGLLILFLSASGLFIALVNVSHILMSRGLRMRKGVGIMMALGASRSSVLSLFATEACAISAVGAFLGALFAFPLSASMQSALGLTGGSWLYVALGVLISWALTLVFSVVPAWQNSRIVPAEAMRAA
jgi:hypothetical protein